MEETSREKIFVDRSWEKSGTLLSGKLGKEILPAFGNATDFIT